MPEEKVAGARFCGILARLAARRTSATAVCFAGESIRRWQLTVNDTLATAKRAYNAMVEGLH